MLFNFIQPIRPTLDCRNFLFKLVFKLLFHFHGTTIPRLTTTVVLDVHTYANGSTGIASDYTGQFVWRFDADYDLRDLTTWHSTGTQAFHFRANYAHELPLALEVVDIQTGAVSLLWEDSENVFSPHGHWLSLSPHGRFIAFHNSWREVRGSTWLILDTNGNEIGRYEQIDRVFWCNDEGFVMGRRLDTGQTPPVYVSLPDGSEQPWQPAVDGQYLNGQWSPDGRYFVYQNHDGSHLQLYLWQVGQTEASPIYTFDDSNIQGAGMEWHPNSNHLYITTSKFRSDDWELKMLDISTGVRRVLAASAEP